MRLLKELQQLGVKETVSVQNEKKLWDPNFLWAGSRLENYSTRNKSHFLQKKKKSFIEKNQDLRGTPKSGEELKVSESSPN